MAAARRKHPGNDIVTQLAFEPLTQREFDVYFVLLATAGNETTRHTITHGLLGLLEHPDQMQRLRDDPELFKPAAEEMLRWATPVHHFRRTTTRETELAGTTIPAGAKVTTWFVSGNRDEDVFDEPGHVRRRPHAEQAHGLRARRDPPLHGRAPRAHGDPDRVRGAAQARAGRSSSPASPSGCARTSSTASSGCRCGWRRDRAAAHRPRAARAPPTSRRRRRAGRRSSGWPTAAAGGSRATTSRTASSWRPGEPHVAYELRRACSLDAARAASRRVRRALGGARRRPARARPRGQRRAAAALSRARVAR